ncbi:MAG: TetR/AcrR family transcriptional regulator [Arenicellales bacterium]
MVNSNAERLSRESWILGALELMLSTGVEGIKIVPLAERLGVTSGSFYWHFKNRRELYEALLAYWEQEMTEAAVEAAIKFEGSPEKRIWKLMEQVMETGLARYDLAIWHWAQSDSAANEVFQRVLERRFTFAKWLFEQAGYSKVQAEARGRMMVVYMMGESTLIVDAPAVRKERLRVKYEILTNA